MCRLIHGIYLNRISFLYRRKEGYSISWILSAMILGIKRFNNGSSTFLTVYFVYPGDIQSIFEKGCENIGDLE
jgi:hypothetical protein